MTYAFAPEYCHSLTLDAIRPALAFDGQMPVGEWQEGARVKLSELLGALPEPCDLELSVEYDREEAGFRERRFVFTAERGAQVPGHLLTPLSGTGPFPLVICLQGHTTGMHISMGRIAPDVDPAWLEREHNFIEKQDHAYAIQAVERGYAALIIEQRCFGERSDRRSAEIHDKNNWCGHASMTALLLGRTMIGERVYDVRRAIDAAAHFPELDMDRVALMGHSGGGTITTFASALDTRIKAAMISCYVCMFRDCIGSIDHCPDNYVPGILNWFEMPDIVGLIAPRPLVVVAGEHDPIFPIAGTRRAYEGIERVYAAAGASDRLSLVVGNGDHRFFAADSWAEFGRVTGWA